MTQFISSTKINYFRIGSFVLIGIALLITAIIMFSSGKWFQHNMRVETYFNESIQGLTLGSSVKYQGVEIGYIKKIDFVNDIYAKSPHLKGNGYDRYIYVEMIVAPNFLTQIPKKDISFILKRSVSEGLRAKLALQGLTGKAYLELTYLNPKENRPLHIDWVPQNYYIPSTHSTLAQVGDSAQKVLYALKDVDFQKAVSNFQEATTATHDVLKKMNILLNDWQYTSKNLRSLSEHAKLAPSQVIFGEAPPPLDPESL